MTLKDNVMFVFLKMDREVNMSSSIQKGILTIYDFTKEMETNSNFVKRPGNVIETQKTNYFL